MPAVILMAALTMILIVSIIGITESSDIELSMKSVGCSFAVVFDDIINGNVTSDGNGFFIGMEGLSRELGELNDNLATAQS